MRWIKQLWCRVRTGHLCPSQPFMVSYPPNRPQDPVRPIVETRLCIFCGARVVTERPDVHRRSA